jgi:uncharacterized protein YgiB involved in biofilm formation
MKRSRYVALAAMGAGTLAMVAAFGGDPEDEVAIYRNADHCKQDGIVDAAACEAAFAAARKSHETGAPTYDNEARCKAEHSGNCEKAPVPWVARLPQFLLDGKVYPTLGTCIADAANTERACNDAYRTALSVHNSKATRHASQAECEAAEGVGNCNELIEAAVTGTTTSRTTSSSSYRPIWHYYMFGRAPGAVPAQPLYHARNASLGLRTADGRTIGSATGVRRLSSYASRPNFGSSRGTRTTTISRGGFGSSTGSLGG